MLETGDPFVEADWLVEGEEEAVRAGVAAVLRLEPGGARFFSEDKFCPLARGLGW